MLWRALARILASAATLLAVVTRAFFLMRARRAGRSTWSGRSIRDRWKTCAGSTGSTSRCGGNISIYLERAAHGDFGPSYSLARLSGQRAVRPGAAGLGAARRDRHRARARPRRRAGRLRGGAPRRAAGAGRRSPRRSLGVDAAELSSSRRCCSSCSGFGCRRCRSAAGATARARIWCCRWRRSPCRRSPSIARLTRAAMIEALAEPAIAHAARLRPAARVILGSASARRCCRCSPISGRRRRRLLTGSVVVETIFGIPGLAAISSRRRSTAITRWRWARWCVVAFAVIVVNLLVDSPMACSIRACAWLTRARDRSARPVIAARRRLQDRSAMAGAAALFAIACSASSGRCLRRSRLRQRLSRLRLARLRRFRRIPTGGGAGGADDDRRRTCGAASRRFARRRRLNATLAGARPIDARGPALFARSDVFGRARIIARRDDGRRVELAIAAAADALSARRRRQRPRSADPHDDRRPHLACRRPARLLRRARHRRRLWRRRRLCRRRVDAR